MHVRGIYLLSKSLHQKDECLFNNFTHLLDLKIWSDLYLKESNNSFKNIFWALPHIKQCFYFDVINCTNFSISYPSKLYFSVIQVGHQARVKCQNCTICSVFLFIYKAVECPKAKIALIFSLVGIKRSWLFFCLWYSARQYYVDSKCFALWFCFQLYQCRSSQNRSKLAVCNKWFENSWTSSSSKYSFFHKIFHIIAMESVTPCVFLSVLMKSHLKQ